MRLRITTDLLTGLLFLAIGGFAIVYGSQYPLGTAARMGPGYYPMIASIGLSLIGVILVVRGFLGGGEPVGHIPLRPLVLVLLGTLAFGLIIEQAGLLISGLVLVVAARLADPGARIIETLLLALALIAITGAIFVYGLGLPIHILPF